VWRQTGSETLDAFAGLGRRAPLLAACMFCFMISLIGLPPFAGFWAKINLLRVLMLNAGWWWALVAVIAINTILSAFYYFRVIRAMYVTPSDDAPFRPQLLGTGIAIASAVALVVLFVGYNPFSAAADKGARLAGVGGVGSAAYAPAPAAASAAGEP